MTQGRRIQIRVATMLALALIVAVIIGLNDIPRSVA